MPNFEPKNAFLGGFQRFKFSFINLVILSKFKVNSITLTDFGNFLNIGKFTIFVKFDEAALGLSDPPILGILKNLTCFQLSTYK